LQKRHDEYLSWTQEYERVLQVEKDLDKQLGELNLQFMTIRSENNDYDLNESEIKKLLNLDFGFIENFFTNDHLF